MSRQTGQLVACTSDGFVLLISSSFAFTTTRGQALYRLAKVRLFLVYACTSVTTPPSPLPGLALYITASAKDKKHTLHPWRDLIVEVSPLATLNYQQQAFVSRLILCIRSRRIELVLASSLSNSQHREKNVK